MKLYCFGQSGHSYKVANYLNLAGIEFEPVFVDFFNGEARSEGYQSINQMGEAPVFVDGDIKLTQSGVILNYLVEKTGQFAPSDPHEDLRWILWDNHKGSSQFGMTRFYLNFLPKNHYREDVAVYLLSRVKAALPILDQALSAQDFVAGRAMGPADFSCASYLWYPEEFGFDRAEYPNINAWLTRIENMPNWKHPYDLMPTDQSALNRTAAAQNWHKELS